MRSPTSLHESRVYSPENFRSSVQKDFCNSICQQRPSLVRASRFSLAPCSPANECNDASAKRLRRQDLTSTCLEENSRFEGGAIPALAWLESVDEEAFLWAPSGILTFWSLHTYWELHDVVRRTDCPLNRDLQFGTEIGDRCRRV